MQLKFQPVGQSSQLGSLCGRGKLGQAKENDILLLLISVVGKQEQHRGEKPQNFNAVRIHLVSLPPFFFKND